MPKTRSQAAEEKLRVYEDYPASPSENAPASAMEPPTSEMVATETTEQRPPQPTITRTRAPSIRSIRSTTSLATRIRQAETAAGDKIAELKRQEIQLQISQIRKQLATDIATMREETDRESLCAEEADAERRVSDWLQRTNIRGERKVDNTERNPAALEERPPITPNRVHYETERRSVSPTPARSRERGIEKLANTLEKLARNRAPPRQTQDLPIFSGDIGDWLPFKAAMRETTNLHGFSPVENMARLRTCLRGEARRKVSALLSSTNDPAAVMKTLEQCYGHPESIIDNAVADMKKLPRLGTTTNELNNFAIDVQNIVTVISCVDQEYLRNPMLTRYVTEKLNPYLRVRWCDYANAHKDCRDPKIITLSRYLMKEANDSITFLHLDASTSQGPRKPHKENKLRPDERRKMNPVYATTELDGGRKQLCFCCGAEHETPKCDKLKNMTVQDRWQWAKETRVCFICLSSKHMRFKCRAKKCGINECRLPHHSLLHTEKKADESPKEETVMATTMLPTASQNKVLLKVCPVIVKGPNEQEIKTYALLDEGSTISLIDRELATTLDADGPVKPLNIHGISHSKQEPGSKAVEIRIKGIGGERYYDINVRTMESLTLGKHSVRKDVLKYKHLSKLRQSEVCFEQAEPKILIGADQWPLIVSRKLLTGKRRQPAASLTQLGWIIHGSTPTGRIVESEATLHVRASQHIEKKDEELSDLVKSHFEIDALGITKKRKPIAKEERAVAIFNATVRKTNERYEVGLPWSDDERTLPPSYNMALCRLRNIERKMDRSPPFKAAYTAQIQQLLDKGYASRSDHDTENNPRQWYLPHFAVTNPNKPGKIRMVFDAAARANGVCLNDALLDGPDLLQNLPGILFRFRMKPIAVAADIREMFLQIKIRKEDQPAQHFLWRGEDRTAPPTKYTMTSMIFGARSSPFLAHSVRNKNAADHRNCHPCAFKAITESHYMDDWVESFESKEKAAQTISETREVHRRAGFELAGWSTNEPELLTAILEEDKAHAPKELGEKANVYEKTLGVLWMSTTDELAFNTRMPRVPEEVRKGIRQPTKRETLGAVMSIFDPLGLLSPYTITAKIMLQNLWRQKIDWDDSLPYEEAAIFEDWQNDLTYIEDLRLNRCYDKSSDIIDRQIHVFCDASEQAYATAAYWRLKKKNGSITVTLIAGKARVAPMKTQSIPRLELQAGLIGARLAAQIKKEHKTEAKTTLWTDSRTVLHWIRNESIRYTPYVAHRLTEITELTRTEQWRWVPTALNTADDATRAGNTRLTKEDRWFTGPQFLYEPENRWPKETGDHQTNADEQIAFATAASDPSIIDIGRFSSYNRLINAVAYVLLFVDKCRRQAIHLTADHLKRAERLITQLAQKESFPDEMRKLGEGKNVDRSSRLYKLDPKYGEDKVIRLNGRINAATVPSEMKEPPILDGSHRLTKLLIQREHERRNHVGQEQLVNTLRQRHWILRLRPTVKTVLKNCLICKLRKAAPSRIVKGDLPRSRVNAFTRPFSHCGIDCFGPITVTIGRRREKRWGMLFTCLTVRAVHLEVISSLSTDSAIMALRRMAARRGWPDRFISDNATNFRGAETELKKAYEKWSPSLQEYVTKRQIDWRYIDPGAPNQGGAWERLIRSVKIALMTALNERAPREEVLITALTEIEHTINSRPLTHVSVEPNDKEALTPNHFLLGTATGLPCVGDCEIADQKTWRASQALANAFWTRWIREYLPSLTPRNDVRNKVRNIAEGDLVIIADGLLPRNVWPRGQIEKVYMGPDGVARSADVRTRGGIFRRPAKRLVVLPKIEGSEDLRRGEDVADDA